MSNTNQSYKNILKTTTLFGSVQIVILVMGVIRAKAAAYWLGTSGVGLLGLLTSTIALVVSVTNLGLPISLVRFLSSDADANVTLSKRIAVVKNILWLVSFTGGFLTFIFASVLSELTFDDASYTWAFQWLAISVIFKQLAAGFSSILQGSKKLNMLANANIFANICGLFITLPIYYFYREEGIVFNFIIIAVFEFLVLSTALRKTGINKAPVSIKYALYQSKPMIKMGLVLSITGSLTLLSAYLVQVFIARYDSLNNVGIYVAAFTILNSYVGLVFTVMGTEYFPRIAQEKINDSSLNTEVNKQIYIGFLLMMPILLLLLLVSPMLVKILYNTSFLAAIPYIEIGTLGMFFRTVSWALGFVILAKGSRKLIFRNALIYNTLFLCTHLLGYYINGFVGMGWAFSAYYLFHLVGNYYICRKHFFITLDASNRLYTFALGLIITLNLLLSFFMTNDSIKIILQLFSFFILSGWSVYKLYTLYKWKD